MDPNKNFAFIYGLVDPRCGTVRYIGKANDIQGRLQKHISESRTLNRPVNCWVKKLLSLGLKPQVVLLEAADDWVEAERRLIAEYRLKGRLLNLADGGDQPSCPREVRVANAAKMQSHPNTVANRKKNGAAQLKRLASDPVAMALRGIVRRLSLMATDMRNIGALETEAKLRGTIATMKVKFKAEPELMFYRFAQHPKYAGMMDMPKNAKSELQSCLKSL